MPFLLIIPLMVWTLSGGQTRLRLWRHRVNLRPPGPEHKGKGQIIGENVTRLERKQCGSGNYLKQKSFMPGAQPVNPFGGSPR